MIIKTNKLGIPIDNTSNQLYMLGHSIVKYKTLNKNITTYERVIKVNRCNIFGIKINIYEKK
jgi:hypothetical protein